MSYSIKLSKEAESDIDYLYHSDKRLFHRILKKIEVLQNNPFEGKPLIGIIKGSFPLDLETIVLFTCQHTPKKLSISLP